MPTFLTACPRNCYSTCTMRVTVEENRVVRIEGDPANLATPGGPCVKGLAYVERTHSPDRLVEPMHRGTDGAFRPMAWDEAIELVASKLEDVRSRFGPQAVLYYAASGTKGLLNSAGPAFWRLFGGCTTTYGDLCWPAGLEATRLTLGDNSHNAPWDLVNARLIVLWGKNSAETNIHQIVHLDEALQSGAKLVVIDPRRTESAERADLHLPLRPGSDGALALGVGHLLLRDGRIDRPFIERHVLGFDDYARLVASFPPERTAAICGLRADQVEALASLIGTSSPVSIVPGFGMQRFTNSGQTMRAMLALLAVTGNIGRRGAGWMYANLQTHVFSTVKEPMSFYPPAEPDGAVRVSISTARLGRDMLAQEDPPLAFAWVERGNPIPQNPETLAVVKAFRRLEFRVVVDEFMTDTAREADLVLPAKNLFEQTDVIGAYWHPYLQLRPQIVTPPAGVWPETEIYRALGKRLGLDQEQLDAAIPSDDAIEGWLGAKLETIGMTLDQLRGGPVLSPAFREVAFDDLRFPTPSGRIELRSEEARARWGVDELPAWSEPEEQPDARLPLHLLTPNTKNRIHSQFGNLDTIRRMAPAPFLSIHPADAKARDIRDGEGATVWNGRGSLTLPVRFDFGLRRGCVCVTNGFWLTEGGAVNVLTAARETDMGHGAAFHDNAVEVTRA